MLGRFLSLVIFLVVVLAAAGAGGYVKLTQWAAEPVLVTGEKVVDVPSGTPLGRLAVSLKTEGIVSSSQLFHVLVRLRGSYRQFQAGKYRFTGRVTPEQVIHTIMKGDVFQPVLLSITVPEGFTQKQVLERLAANQVGHLVELQRHVKDPVFLKAVQVEADSLEGYLYPATYSFTEVPSASKALETMVKTFWQNMPKDYTRRIAERGLDLHKAVTFASLIEAETLHDDERGKVAEVIWRRLRDDVPLGIDAALIYGIPDYAGDLKTVHLNDAKNRFNTRIHRGLPPSPIGNPSAKSLAAVLEPTNQGYYYYVLIPGSDRHHFSKTLKEHNQHVRNLVNAYKRDKSTDKSSKD